MQPCRLLHPKCIKTQFPSDTVSWVRMANSLPGLETALCVRWTLITQCKPVHSACQGPNSLAKCGARNFLYWTIRLSSNSSFSCLGGSNWFWSAYNQASFLKQWQLWTSRWSSTAEYVPSERKGSQLLIVANLFISNMMQANFEKEKMTFMEDAPEPVTPADVSWLRIFFKASSS